MGDTYSLYDPENSMDGAASSNYSAGIDFGTGWDKALQGVLSISANAYAQNMLMQTNQQGQRWIEGQRLAVLQNGLGIPTGTLLLVAGAVALFVMLNK